MPIDVDRLRAALADRYAIERQIGRGGMATVYLAEDLKHRRQVAVKVLEPDLASHLGAGRFLREIETAARLNHPHILPLYDSDEADGFLYYVMPYMSGDSLRDHLARERQLPVDEAVHLAREIADGLDYAHEQGVVHRDIKPGNIMLSRGHAVIADFGIARAVAEAGGERVTRTGVSLGSPTYMSPEQAAGSEAVDGRADIYALGCVLYEMLAGEPPFSAGTHAALMARKQLESAPRLASVRDTVPPDLDEAVARALANVPADRFRTGGEFSRVLAALPGGGTPEITGPTGSRAMRAPGSRRWVIGAGVVALAFVLGWLLFGRSGDSGPAADASGSDGMSAETGRAPAAGRAGASGGAALDKPAELRTIAVLPFLSSSAQGDDATFFADGIHDEMLTQLSKIGDLKVISRTSVMQYAGTTKTMDQIGRELGAGAILEGSVQRSGDGIRVTVQLIDAREDSHLWAETYDRELTAANIFTIQTEIAEHVAAALEATLTPGEQGRIQAQPTDNFEAYELYLRGVHSINQYLHRFDERDIHDAVEYLTAAVELDPEFAAAHARLANAYFGAAFGGGLSDTDLSEDEAERIVSTAERALELDPTIGEAHAVLALVAENMGDYETADREYRRAIELSPSFAGAREWYADMLLQHYGRTDAAEALQQYLRAHELSPTSTTASAGVGQAYYLNGDYDGAIDFLRNVLEAPVGSDVATGFMYRALGRSLLEKGLNEEAIATDRRLSELIGSGAPACLDVCLIALARSGRADEAREGLGSLIESVPNFGSEWKALVKYAEIARVYGALGETDQAFDWLEQDLEAFDLQFSYLSLDPQWDPLREDPRFDALLRRAEGEG